LESGDAAALFQFGVGFEALSTIIFPGRGVKQPVLILLATHRLNFRWVRNQARTGGSPSVSAGAFVITNANRIRDTLRGGVHSELQQAFHKSEQKGTFVDGQNIT
jgi:hypothetical protein